MIIPKNKLFISTPASALRLLVVGLFDAVLVWLIVQLLADGSYPLAAVFTALGLLITASLSLERFRAYRWLSIGLGLALLFVLYPIFYTLYLSTTNTGGGHVLTKQQVIENLSQVEYVPEGGQQYRWTAYRSPDGEYALWLQADDGSAALAQVAKVVDDAQPGTAGIGPADENGIPTEIAGFTRLEPLSSAQM